MSNLELVLVVGAMGAVVVLVWGLIVWWGTIRVHQGGGVSSVQVSIQLRSAFAPPGAPARLSVTDDSFVVRPFLPFVAPMRFERSEVARVVVRPGKLVSSMTVDGGPGRHLDDRAILIDGRAPRILREHGWVVVDPRDPGRRPSAAAEPTVAGESIGTRSDRPAGPADDPGREHRR